MIGLKRDFPVVMYTDASVNPDGSGGWGAWVQIGTWRLVIGGRFRYIKRSEPAELLAIVRALDWLKYPSRAQVFTDCELIWYTFLGERKRTENMLRFWQEYDRAVARHACIEIRKIPGHKGVYGNERAHNEARRRAKRR